mgnify:FL=1
MEKMDLSKKVLASLLTMSCVYLGGTSALPMAEAAENDPNNTCLLYTSDAADD